MRLYAILAVTTVAFSLPQTASGDTNSIMRRLGFAWSDGYHSQTMQAYGSGRCANGNCGGHAARPHSPHTIVHGTHQYHGTSQYQGRMRPLPTPATREWVIPAPMPTAPYAVLPTHQPQIRRRCLRCARTVVCPSCRRLSNIGVRSPRRSDGQPPDCPRNRFRADVGPLALPV